MYKKIVSILLCFSLVFVSFVFSFADINETNNNYVDTDIFYIHNDMVVNTISVSLPENNDTKYYELLDNEIIKNMPIGYKDTYEEGRYFYNNDIYVGIIDIENEEEQDLSTDDIISSYFWALECAENEAENDSLIEVIPEEDTDDIEEIIDDTEEVVEVEENILSEKNNKNDEAINFSINKDKTVEDVVVETKTKPQKEINVSVKNKEVKHEKKVEKVSFIDSFIQWLLKLIRIN